MTQTELDLSASIQRKNDGLDRMEAHYADNWLQLARSMAHHICRQKGSVSIVDIWIHCPPPRSVHRNALGAVFRGDEWEVIGFMQNPRKEAHARRVLIYKLKAPAA